MGGSWSPRWAHLECVQWMGHCFTHPHLPTQGSQDNSLIFVDVCFLRSLSNHSFRNTRYQFVPLYWNIITITPVLCLVAVVIKSSDVWARKKNHCTSDYLTPKWNGACSSHGVARQPWHSREQGQINSSRNRSCSRVDPTPTSVCKTHILWAENYGIRRGIRQTFQDFFPFQKFWTVTSWYPGSLLLSPIEQRLKGLAPFLL